MMTRIGRVAAILFGLAMVPLPAFACGVSGPDNVWSCSLEEHDEALRPRWHVGLAGVYSSTALHFGHDLRFSQSRDALLASAGYAPTPRLLLQASAGAAFDGQLRTPDGRYDLSAGPTGAIGAAYRIVDGQPFVTLSLQLSAATADTRREDGASPSRYTAFDLRLGVIAGLTLFERLSPYVLARGFGGPVFWHYLGRARTGTDVSHYQIGAGASFVIAERLDLFVEGVPLGERALAGGATIAL
jgi:hypothetical protein